MVERRLQILMISWRPDERAASAFLSRYPSTKGPFQTERAMTCPLFLLPRVAAGNDELGGRLVTAGLLALGREPPRRDRMPAARGAALAAAMGMIDRVHGDAAVVRPPAEPARPPRLADADGHVVGVGDRTDAGHAAAVHQPLLAGIEPQDHVILVATDDLRIGPRRPRQLPALADLELDVVHDGAHRHVADRHGVARLHVDMLPGNHGIALREPLRRQDISRFPVLVAHQRDEPGTVRIVLDALDAAGHVEFAPLEIDAAVSLLVTAAAKPHGDPPIVVAAARGTIALGQRLDRLAPIEAGAVDQDQLAAARGDRLIGLECHVAAPSLKAPS